MVKMRQEAQKNNSSANIKLVKDKLFVNNQPIKGKFESNHLDHITRSDAIDYNHIQHKLPETVKNSVFQGHYQSVHTQMEASQVLRSCYQGDTAKSDHIIYAYRLLDVNVSQDTTMMESGVPASYLWISYRIKASLKEY